MSTQKTKKPTLPTVITITLPESEEETRSGTLLIGRGDLAHMGQFTYASLGDLTGVIKAGLVTLAAIEADPPKDASKSAPPTTTHPKPEVKKDEEPTVDVPLKKGSLAVKISYLKIIGGETDAAAYKQAVIIAGRLIDGKLWDGQSPIRIDDVYAVQKKLQHLTERDLSLFELTDFVQVDESPAPADDPVSNPSDLNDADTVFDAQNTASPSDQSTLL